jgi:hypothetical protein
MQHVRRVGNVIAISLQKDAKTWLLLFSLVYCFVTVGLATRLFWFDELITYDVSRLPTMADVWAALRNGADFNPPLFYIATRASQSIFGHGRVATRLPEIAGFLVMCLCMYKFVARRCPGPYALVAFLFPLVTSGYSYAIEARSYGLEFGFLGIALVAWQSAAQPGRRLSSLVLFYLALMATLLTHCYAILLLIPFGIAELTRTIRSRRVDWPMLVCFLAFAPVALVYLPLLAASRQFIFRNVIFRPTFLSIPTFYVGLLHFTIWPMTGAALIVDRQKSTNTNESSGIPLHEISCLVGLLCIPVFAVLLAMSATGVYVDRYGLASMVGIGILFPLYLSYRTGADIYQGGVITTIFLSSILLSAGISVIRADRPPQNAGLNLATVRPNLPIVISSPIMFLELDHNEEPTVAARLYFLTDRSSALRYTGTDGFDLGYPLVRKRFLIGGNIQDYNDFVHNNRSFLVYGTYSEPLEWVIRRLLEDNIVLRFLGQEDGRYGTAMLFEVGGK